MKRLSHAQSAFTVAYFILFLLAWALLFYQAFTRFECPGEEALSESTRRTNMIVTYVILVITALALAFHILRIYVTLHDLEKGGVLYERLLAPLKPWQRIIEFIVRVVLIVCISLKITHWLEVKDTFSFGLFVGIMYSALLLWDLVLLSFRWRIEWKYFITSLAGFILGWSVCLISKDPTFEREWFLLELLVVGLFGLVIGGSIVIPYFWARSARERSVIAAP